jgi:hypothetical protein
MIMWLKLWVLFLTCLACRSLPNKLRFRAIWILKSAVTWLVQCKVEYHEDLVLDFSLTHPQSGFSTLHPVGSWKPDAHANLSQSKNRRHAIPYEQANHVFLSLTADTNSPTTLCAFFGWLADSASTNSRLSQPSSQDLADPLPGASGLFVPAHTGSDWGRSRESCGGPFHA